VCADPRTRGPRARAPGSVRRFFRRMRPRLVIVMETELWPNMYAECGAQGVPLVLANARISPRSVGRYKRFSGLFRAALAHGIVVATQSAQDAERFRLIGANPANVVVTGNLKADLVLPRAQVEAGRAFRAEHAASRPVWIAASTHEGEEAAALEAHAIVTAKVPDALLLLVPRHPDRFNSVAEQVAEQHAAFGRRTLGRGPRAEEPVYLVDTLGELPMFYAAADVAFVGGSLVQVGGHNLLEPAALSLPVLAGPHNFNAEDIASLLVESGGLEIVPDARALGDIVSTLLQDPLEDLVQPKRRNQEVARLLDRRREERGVRPTREVLEPGAGVDDVHVRSASRSTRVSIPRRKPRIVLRGRTGISSMRSS